MMALNNVQGAAPGGVHAQSIQPGSVTAVRMFGWINLAVMAAYLLNTYLTFWAGLPGASLSGPAAAMGQAALYVLLPLIAVLMVQRSRGMTLRQDSERVTRINTFIVRWMFWAVVIVGFTDGVISFLRVEGMLEAVTGVQLASDLGRAQFRGAYVHMPLIALSFLAAAFTRTLGFHWLGLMVVVAELLIVIGRFVFSYEQAFLADLVRFWYAAAFLFASAYTLVQEGHVRVDVLYAGFTARAKGFANIIGCIFFGLTFCWTILVVGLASRQSIIVSPMLAYETTQAGFGMYVKYLMAGFLGVFAVTMMIQFVSYLFASVADARGDEGGRDHSTVIQH